MSNRRIVYENHLAAYKKALAQRVELLKSRKLADKAEDRDPTFRAIKGKVRQFERRLRALDKVASVNADVEARRAERLANPKVKEKKPKAPAAAAPKAKKSKS